MSKSGVLFIAFCAFAIMVSVTVLTTGVAGLPLFQGLVIGLSFVTLLGVAHLAFLHTRAVQTQEEDQRRMRDDIAMLMDRLAALDLRQSRTETFPVEALRKGLTPIANEITELGTLLQDLAEQVDAHETLLNEPPSMPAVAAPPVRPARVSVRVQEIEEDDVEDEDELDPIDIDEDPEAAAELPPDLPEEPSPLRVDPELAREVRVALEQGNVEVHLQPIVSLPQRKIAHYEVLARLRDGNDNLLTPEEFIPALRQDGLMAALDALVVDKALRIARRLKVRERETSLFVNLCSETLVDDEFVHGIARRLDANTDLTSHLVLEVRQNSLRTLGLLEGEMLASLADKGFRFSLDAVGDLALDPRALHTLGFRHVKVPVALLFDQSKAARAQIHPADIPGLLKRHGLSVVVTNVETEREVADILDLDITAAQGYLFGAPRPVRPEVFIEPGNAPRSSAHAVEAAAVRGGEQRPAATRRGIGSIARRA